MQGLGLGLGLAQYDGGSGEVSIRGNPSISGTTGGPLTVIPAETDNAVLSNYQWYRDFLPIPDATGTTLDGSAWPGSITVVQTAYGTVSMATAMSVAFDNGINETLEKSDAFDDAVNNQAFTTYAATHGWRLSGSDATNQAKYVTKVNAGDGFVAATGNVAPATVDGENSFATCQFDVGTTNQAVEGDNGSATGAAFSFVLWWRDDNNFVYGSFGGAAPIATFNIHQVVNGTDTILGTWGVAPFGAGATCRIEIIGGILTYKLKKAGETAFTQYALNHDTAGATPPMAGTDGVALTTTPGTGVGFYLNNSFNRAVTGFRGYSMDLPITIGTITSDTQDNVPTLTVNVGYSGSPTDFDIGAMGEDGLQAVARVAATSVSFGTAGQATVTLSDAGLRVLEGKICYVQIWPTGSELGYAKRFDMPVYQTVFPYVQGINEGSLGQGKPVDWARDLYMSSEWRVGGSFTFLKDVAGYDPGYNAAGFPSVYPPGASSLRLILARGAYTVPERLGTYTITVPPGMTVTGSPTASVSQVSGVYKLARLDSDAAVAPFIELAGTIPVGGGYCSITMDDDPHPERKITDITGQSYQALGKVLRCMTARHTNTGTFKTWAASAATPFTESDRITGQATTFPLAIEHQIAMCNESGLNLYHNDSHVVDDDYRLAEATYAASNLDPSLHVEIEFSNEIWNNGFTQNWQIALLGARMGFAEAGCTSVNLASAKNILSNPLPGDPNSDVTNFDVQDGELLFLKVNGIGLQVLRAKGAQLTGATVPHGTSDANWDLVYSNTDMVRARLAYQAFLSARVWEIWDTAFASAGRVRPLHVIGMQTTSDIASGTVPQSYALDFGVSYKDSIVPLREITDRIAVAPYWRGVGGNLGDYTATVTGAHPFGSTQRDLLSTDPDAFRAAFWAAANDAIDDVVAQAKNAKHSIARYLTSHSLHPDTIQLMSYEANWHVQFYHWPTALKDDANAEFGNLIRSAEYGAATAYYIDRLRRLVGGTHIMFDRIGLMPDDGSDGGSQNPMQNWGIEENEQDTATSGASKNYRYTAFAKANAGIFS